MSALRIVIMAKAPLPGQAKTRLIPALGAARAAALAARLLQHATAQAVTAGLGRVELCITQPQHPCWRQLQLPPTLAYSEQGAGDLGQRMARAAQRTLAGGESLLLIGSDCPALNSERLRLAAASLQQHDCCLQPVADGGYALLGLTRYHPTLFQAIPWSTATVAAITRERIAARQWSLSEFDPLQDIDQPEDLAQLPASWLDQLHRHHP